MDSKIKKANILKAFVLIIAVSFIFSIFPKFVSGAACQCIGDVEGQACGVDPTSCAEDFIDYCGYFGPPCSGWCQCVPGICGECSQGQKQCASSTIKEYCINPGRDCWIWTTEFCGLSSCPASQCNGLTTYISYPNYCDNTCSGGDCSACTCTATSGTCDSSKTCNQANCGTGQTQCHITNSGTWQWDLDPSAQGETNCADGFDNDCDGKCDTGGCVPPLPADPECSAGRPTSPALKFRQGATSNYATTIGSNGIMDIAGTKAESQGTITSTTNDFIVKDSSSNIVALISYSGNLKLKGQVYESTSQSQLNTYKTDAQDQLIIQKADGNVVAVFDTNGNLYLLGTLNQNQAVQ